MQENLARGLQVVSRAVRGPAGGGGVHAEGSAVHVRGTLGTAWTSPASTPWWWWWWD